MTTKNIIGKPRIRNYEIGDMEELLRRADSYVEPSEEKVKKVDKEKRKKNSNSKVNIEPLSKENFIYVPSVNLYFTKEKIYNGKNWFECHKELQSNNQRMPTLPEFIEFLKYTKMNFLDIYNEVTELRNPWRGCWIDADFKLKGDDLYYNYLHVLDLKGNLIPKKFEILDKNTLMQDKTPGISLEDFLNKNHTSQGFPNNKVNLGDFYYYFPRRDNNSVARFSAGSGGAYLSCSGDPSNGDSSLGVFGVAQGDTIKLAVKS